MPKPELREHTETELQTHTERRLLEAMRDGTLTDAERAWLCELVVSCSNGDASRAAHDVPWRIRGILQLCFLQVDPRSGQLLQGMPQ